MIGLLYTAYGQRNCWIQGTENKSIKVTRFDDVHRRGGANYRGQYGSLQINLGSKLLFPVK